MNFLERTIATISPAWAARRAMYRHQWRAAYEAAETGRLRRANRETRGPNNAVKTAIKPVRETARQLEENHDLVTGILNTIAANVVGTGITIEPQPKTLTGDLNEDIAAEILRAWQIWCLSPETTGRYDKGTMERAACISWARDGEVFGQHLVGAVGGIRYAEDRVPYSIEMLEADLCPLDFEDTQKNIIQGVQLDKWGKPTNYWLYEQHPQDAAGLPAIKPIKAEKIVHLAHCRRVRQVRGISMLAPVMNRLRDLKDYEQSEQVAARVSAAMAAYVKKGTPDMYSDSDLDTEGNRLFSLEPGIIWDNLYPGEDVGTIQSNRPSNLLQPFRDSMLKAIASGVGASYSSISNDYSGTYSSQRQMLVENFMTYNVLTTHFVSQWTRPMYQQFIAAWLLSRQGGQPAGVDPLTIDDAEFRGPVMPWIDPSKEATALVDMVQAGFKSRAQVIRERGSSPDHVFQQLLRERSRDYDNDLVFSSDYAHLAQRGEIDASPRPEDQGTNTDGQAAA